ncbi:MAG: DUF4190 domain-containing protein [Lachnospiraceae bacterium]|nr:DUF4190 domain-containing protein [Lachnospiraceae bacterium]
MDDNNNEQNIFYNSDENTEKSVEDAVSSAESAMDKANETFRNTVDDVLHEAATGEPLNNEEKIENVTAQSEIVDEGGTEKKYSSETERFADQLKQEKEQGSYNSGSNNSGSYNSGNYNSQNNFDSNIYGNPDGMQEGKGMAIASMVCGILSIVCCCTGIVSVILSVVAIVLGVICIKRGYAGKEMAIAGIITGGCGAVIGLVGMIFSAAFSGLASTLDVDSLQDLEDFL